MSSPDAADAVQMLKFLVDEIDPVYRPARFLLGYAYLSRGDAKHAVEVFDGLMKEFDAALRNSADKVQTEWSQRLPRMVRLAKRLPVIRDWVIRWNAETLGGMMGGDFYRAAVAWKELKQLEEANADQSERGSLLREMNIESALTPISKDFREVMEIAIGDATPTN